MRSNTPSWWHVCFLYVLVACSDFVISRVGDMIRPTLIMSWSVFWGASFLFKSIFCCKGSNVTSEQKSYLVSNQ